MIDRVSRAARDVRRIVLVMRGIVVMIGRIAVVVCGGIVASVRRGVPLHRDAVVRGEIDRGPGQGAEKRPSNRDQRARCHPGTPLAAMRQAFP